MTTTVPSVPRVRSWRRRCVPRLLAFVALATLAGCGGDRAVVVEDRSWDPVAPESRRATPSPARDRAPRVHVVVRGDTLHAIGFRYGVTVEALARWNRIASPDTIYPGQRLQVEPSPVERTSRRRDAVQAPPRRASRASDAPRRTGTRDGAEVAPIVSAPPPRIEPLPAPRRAPATEPVAPRDAAPEPAPGTPPVAAPPVPPGVAEDLAAPSETRADTSRAATAAPAPAASTPTPPAAATPSVSIAPAPMRAVGGVSWRWPARGTVANGFRAGDPARQGIDIRGREGDPVHAAADGEVVYSGNGLLGYGELVIVSHGSGFLSAYGHNRKRLVAEGERVRAGQLIAEMGRRAGALDLLHFEIRRDGRPVDPLAYLPPR